MKSIVNSKGSKDLGSLLPTQMAVWKERQVSICWMEGYFISQKAEWETGFGRWTHTFTLIMTHFVR